MAASVWRRSTGSRRIAADHLLNKNVNGTLAHIANAFFERGGDDITFPAVSVAISPGTLYLGGINSEMVFEPAEITISPEELWTSTDMKATIRMSGQLFLKGQSDYLVFEDPAVITLTAPSMD
ncbi:hypothetical protein, partial [Methanoregula sp.]|uniref:hypothetical protein n=1 Tax=Methanoregula sp. TaxID=2052170 RepID=UPI000CCA1344